jgi:hypothetical protein
VCQSHTGRLTGFWFLLNRPKGWILMNEWIKGVPIRTQDLKCEPLSFCVPAELWGDICQVLCSAINRNVCTLYWSKHITTLWINGAFYCKSNLAFLLAQSICVYGVVCRITCGYVILFFLFIATSGLELKWHHRGQFSGLWMFYQKQLIIHKWTLTDERGYTYQCW